MFFGISRQLPVRRLHPSSSPGMAGHCRGPGSPVCAGYWRAWVLASPRHPDCCSSVPKDTRRHQHTFVKLNLLWRSIDLSVLSFPDKDSMLSVTNRKMLFQPRDFPIGLQKRMKVLEVILLSTFHYFQHLPFQETEISSICAAGTRSKGRNNPSNPCKIKPSSGFTNNLGRSFFESFHVYVFVTKCSMETRQTCRAFLLVNVWPPGYWSVMWWANHNDSKIPDYKTEGCVMWTVQQFDDLRVM